MIAENTDFAEKKQIADKTKKAEVVEIAEAVKFGRKAENDNIREFG